MFNARSIRNKQTDLLFECTNNLEAIIAVTETWLSADIGTEFFVDILKSHYFVRADDQFRVGLGGGVLLLIPKLYEFVVFNQTANDYFECVWADLHLPAQRSPFLRVGLYYRTPSANIRLSTDSLISHVKVFCNCAVPVVIFGDFNYPEIKWEGDGVNLPPLRVGVLQFFDGTKF